MEQHQQIKVCLVRISSPGLDTHTQVDIALGLRSRLLPIVLFVNAEREDWKRVHLACFFCPLVLFDGNIKQQRMTLCITSLYQYTNYCMQMYELNRMYWSSNKGVLTRKGQGRIQPPLSVNLFCLLEITSFIVAAIKLKKGPLCLSERTGKKDTPLPALRPLLSPEPFGTQHVLYPSSKRLQDGDNLLYLVYTKIHTFVPRKNKPAAKTPSTSRVSRHLAT